MDNINNISIGDYVKHKTLINLNGGLKMTVTNLSDFQAEVSYFDNDEYMTHRVVWFNLSDLEIVTKAEGGFLQL